MGAHGRLWALPLDLTTLLPIQSRTTLQYRALFLLHAPFLYLRQLRLPNELQSTLTWLAPQPRTPVRPHPDARHARPRSPTRPARPQASVPVLPDQRQPSRPQVARDPAPALPRPQPVLLDTCSGALIISRPSGPHQVAARPRVRPPPAPAPDRRTPSPLPTRFRGHVPAPAAARPRAHAPAPSPARHRAIAPEHPPACHRALTPAPAPAPAHAGVRARVSSIALPIHVRP
ncbi:uncharacterized protein [Palaemon carinicauda]|uniref:uncharacterized protein n=1 Tax=Palaemon carinicauda TaxID=392227 RepID=UPI0035B5E4EF